MASGLIAYTHTQARELAEIHKGIPVWAAPNALYLKSDFCFDSRSTRDSFIFVGRLHSDKKPLLMVEAFEQLQADIGNIRLVIVGDGPMAAELAERVQSSSAASSIEILGHVDDYTVLERLYAKSIASISPGYVGLSVTQSLSFGVPMIISRNEQHAPEIEAVRQGFNCAFFETDDVRSLMQEMLEFVRERSSWGERGPEISGECANSYSVEAMVNGLVAALEDDPA